jgi:predicted extracellular nuclease
VTVTIEGNNDAPVLSATTAVTIDENTVIIPAGISANDVDSNTLTFTISGDDAALFDIDPETGALTFRAAPDFEGPRDLGEDNVYDVRVTVSDGDGGEGSVDIAVTVADVVEIPDIDARINELQYDNIGADVGEFVEVRVAAGQDASVLTVELYNGSNGAVYNTLSLPATPASTEGGFDYYLIELPGNGLQNGAPDGLALVNSGAVVLEFLSYEGTFTATNGTAIGLSSTDIGVSQNADTPVGSALERTEDGDTWSTTETDTRGLNNDTQPPFVGRINELHYDNVGTDVGEFVEIRVVEGTDVSQATVELYNGNGGALYGTFTLPMVPESTQNGFDYYLIELPSNGLQNGAPDGLALVNNGRVIEFLSYEGRFTATNGTAIGLSSTDMGVSQIDAPVGAALERAEDGDTWSATETDTRGLNNDTQPIFSVNAPYEFDFEAEFSTNGWQAISVDSDAANTWFTGSFSGDNFAQVNGFGDTAPANDWLISPLIDISGLTTPIVRFANTKNFDDTGLADPEVNFLYSTDYSGTGDPTDATWIALPYTASTGGFAETSSGSLDLSGVASNQLYFAFQYQSTGTGAGSSSLWQIDDFFVGEDAVPPGDTTLISAVQGTGTASPVQGTVVTVEAVVVGDFQDGAFGTNGDLNGFYLQEEDADADADALSSEGIFVFDGASPVVDVRNGDLVRVTGTVTEFFGETQISNVTSVEIISAGHARPTAAEVLFPVNVTTNANGEFIPDLEQFEGMLVTLPQEMTVSDLFSLGQFGDIGLQRGGLLETFTQANTPSVTDFALFQQNAVANSVLLDDGSTVRNPSVIPFEIAGVPGNIAGEYDAADPLSAGDTVTGLTGVVRFGTGSGSAGDSAFRINPVETPQFVDANPRDTEAPDVGGSVTVSAFNVLNFFTSLGNEGLTSGPDGLVVRGADNLAELDRQLDKLIATLSAIQADVFGLIELENEIGDQNGDGEFAIQVLVDALNSEIPGAAYDFVNPGQAYVGGDAIMVGLIYDANAVRIAPGTTVEVLTDVDLPGLGLDFGNPVFDGAGTSRAPLAATFEEIATGETFTIAVNHFKSKGSISPFGDNIGIGDGTGNNNEARLQAAQALDAWLDTDPTGSGDFDFLIIGDLNAYGMEDPIGFLKSQGYEDQVNAFLPAGEFPYSFGFPVDLDTSPSVQNFGALDYALASGSLAAQVTGAAEWKINSVEASVLDYNTNFKPLPQINNLYSDDPFRSSDHDPLIVGLSLGSILDLA